MNNLKNKKWAHIIGIAGVTTSAIALKYQKLGWKVTGSDQNVYSPVKEILENAGIVINNNYSYKNLYTNQQMPDLVVLGSSEPSWNKEYLFAKKQNLNIKSYPEILEEFVIVPGKSIVVVGTYGKTTITSLLCYIFEKAGLNISYMYGGFTKSLESTLEFKNDSTIWSVVEGDEYITSKVNLKSKFFYYHPNILILNSIEWDHTDIFKTEEEYINNFINLVKEVPSNGMIFAKKTKNIERVLKYAKCKVEYFDFNHNKVNTNLVGSFNNENASAAYQVCKYLKIDESIVQNALQTFEGINRRLQVRFRNESYIIIDDFGASPAKAKGAISAIKNEFSDYKLVVVYEPNEGARMQSSLSLYNNLFDNVDNVILPIFRQMSNRITEVDLESFLKRQLVEVKIVNNETVFADVIMKYLKSGEKIVFAFIGAHDFENKINSVINLLKSNK